MILNTSITWKAETRKENQVRQMHTIILYSILDGCINYNKFQVVLYVSVRNWDLRKAALTGRRDRFNRFVDKTLEEACGLVQELGEKYKNVSQGIFILNIDGFNLVQHGCLQCINLVLFNN